MRVLFSGWLVGLLLATLALSGTVLQMEAFVIPMPLTFSSKRISRKCGDTSNVHYQPHFHFQPNRSTALYNVGGDKRETEREELSISDVTPTSSSSSSFSSRRRKRKETLDPDGDNERATIESLSPAPNPPVLELKPREDTPVELQVMNVKDIVSGSTVGSTAVKKGGIKSMASQNIISTSTTTSGAAPSSIKARNASQGKNDSLDQLLEDARRMKEEEGDRRSGNEASIFDDLENGEGLKSAIRNLLSTIVTADFFIVCGFLLWFLLGIFVRAVFKDDAVQIAFNNNFETLVQPALGILMIAAVAGNFFQDEEQ